MFLGNAKKIIAWTVTVVYGGWLLITTVNEVKQLVDDIKQYKKVKSTYRRKPGEEFIETYFVQ